ncbi:MAG: hypothetical protein ACYTFG_22695, partial [Planctomycetota bacterium]
IFGPWADLSGEAKNACRDLVESEITRAVTYHPRGRYWPGSVGAMYAVIRFLRRRRPSPKLDEWIQRWAARGWRAPTNIRERLYDRGRRRAWLRKPRISLGDLLAGLGRRPSWLVGDYVTGVRVDPRCRGFYADRGRNIVFGYLIGIDLIPTSDGVWCVEA